MEGSSKRRRLQHEKALSGEGENCDPSKGIQRAWLSVGMLSANCRDQKSQDLTSGHVVDVSGSAIGTEALENYLDAVQGEPNEGTEGENGYDEEEEEEDNEDIEEDEEDEDDEGEEEEEDSEDEEDLYLAELKATAKKWEEEKEAEVHRAYLILAADIQGGKSVSIGPMDGGRWELYSSEYLSHYFIENQSTQWLLFGKIYDDMEDSPEMVCEPGQLSAELNIYPEGQLNIYPFTPPTHASLEPVILKSWKDKHAVEVIFLGHGYLKLKVELDILLDKDWKAHGIFQPKMIEFSGVWSSNEDRKRRRELILSRQPRSRSPGSISMAASLHGWH